MIRVSVWTAIFLVTLRVCIGWHFAYEGATKVKSAYQGKATVNEKVFSSETYFRESEGPFGRLIKSRLGDPDLEVVNKVTLHPVNGDASDASPASRFPEALSKEWDDYFNRYVAQYRLDDEQKAKAQSEFDQKKAKFVQWVQGQSDQMDPTTNKPKRVFLTVKRKAPGASNTSADYDQEMTVAERAAELKQKSEEVRTAYSTMERLGKDADAVALRAKKIEVNTIRGELQKEIDEQTKGMKDGLARLLDTRVTAYANQADNKDAETTLNAMLTPMAGGDNPLGRMWDEYATYVKDFSPGITDKQKEQIDEELRAAKLRFDRWLDDKDPYNGFDDPQKEVSVWRAQYAAARAKEGKDKDPAEEKALISQMQAELKAQSDALRAQVGTPLLGEDRAKGYAAPSDERFLWLFPKRWTLIDYLDWSTRWFLLVVGVLLMVGLFTRLSCFSAAGFLFLTILTQPSVPWLPAPPVNEGSYLFVNKNVIEMVALLALMTTRSGRWAGLDAIVAWVFNRR